MNFTKQINGRQPLFKYCYRKKPQQMTRLLGDMKDTCEVSDRVKISRGISVDKNTYFHPFLRR